MLSSRTSLSSAYLRLWDNDKAIVLLKIARVMDEIVVYGVFANLDIRVCDDIAQIYYLPVTRARINLFHFHSPYRKSKITETTEQIRLYAPRRI